MAGRQGWNLRGDNQGRKGVAGEAHYNWKGDGALPASKRQRARTKFKLGPCVRCGKQGVDRHHVDGDTGNNEPENILIVCRRCHMILDGRRERLIKEAARQSQAAITPPIPCRICARPAKPSCNGRCWACARYYDRHGVEWTPAVKSTKPRRAAAVAGETGAEAKGN